MKSKKEILQDEIAKAVGAGKAVTSETVDFSDPNRPKTCLEVDFPILPINQVAVIEGNAGKPIYQMSKWWARRRSSVFRSMLIAAATKAPDDPAHAAKAVWDVYYANHQKKGSFKNIKVADIFMGGGTTLVEGSRLGMQLFGIDLNPVAWFVVKQELAKVDLDEVKRLLADIEAEVKPQIMPFYYCDGPNGEKGKWTYLPSGKVMGDNFDPLSLKPAERKDYKYEGPEIIYTFWAKHGPCQVTGCGHRTPIMTSPVMAIKTLTVKSWEHSCESCHTEFEVEDKAARMAPDVPLFIAPSETPFAILNPKSGITCPNCKHTRRINYNELGKGKNKKVEMSLLVHPQWLAGSPDKDLSGKPFGGSAQDDAESTSRWNLERSSKIRLLEVRGTLPEEVTCPETKVTFKTGKEGGTVTKKSTFACQSDGSENDVLTAVKATGKTGPIAAFAVQGFAPRTQLRKDAYNGRFFSQFDERLTQQYNAAIVEWEKRRNTDLDSYWPKCELSKGWKTHGWAIPEHGFTHYWMMFNPRQLLTHTQLLKSILTVGSYSWDTREYVLGAFQQYLRNQSLFGFWNIQRDTPEPHLSNNNFHPKSVSIENCVFSELGRGNWASSSEGILEGKEWSNAPWDTVSNEMLQRVNPELSKQFLGKSSKVYPLDPLNGGHVYHGSSTDLSFDANSFDLVITDPPFGEIMQYAELADFFYVWLRLALKDKYPDIFGDDYSPKLLEVVSNPYRQPDNPDGFYQRLLTQCWREVHRILKPGGILAFTFHHSEDDPWVSVLESLFDSGFYLEATYPIRSDETKGDNSQFGSQKIEYDIIHVCRKRTEAVKPVSWAKMRREVLDDIRQLQGILEQHTKDGLPTADLRVIKIGKALEYYSKHYGQVFVDDGQPLEVKDALIGIELLMQEDPTSKKEYPPSNAEPATQQFLRIFNEQDHIARDQIQKFMRGTGMAPSEFLDREWCYEEDKVYHLKDPKQIAQSWYGRHREKLKHDYDQVVFMIGACFEGSGINVQDTLKNERFKPHPATKGLLEWHSRHAGIVEARVAAIRALEIYKGWERQNPDQAQQMSLFFEG
ncbi:MAG: DUF1156 domain-containing protein [Deltaproteobacteria bacterium]|nr:DUF1156 domain-containing protein [Deltaproteobacteria bacterium]